MKFGECYPRERDQQKILRTSLSINIWEGKTFLEVVRP
jgi:hypothetical protein